jgi:vacuolar protein sorting-associated protein 35
LPYYNDLLKCQPFSTRRAIAHAVVSSVLKNETLIATSEHVSAVLELCHVLVRDQRDAGAPSRPANSRTLSMRTSHGIDSEEVAEEQGWIARMIHLFYADDLDTQYQLLVAARTVFQSSETGERIKYTLPPLIASAIHLTRRYKYREHFLQDFEQKLDQLFRFIHQVTSQLYNKVDSSSEICLRLNLLALQAADDAKVEGLAYEFAVQVGSQCQVVTQIDVLQAFTVYEESISDSKAQLQAITLIISALQQTRVFGTDNFDTLITKAALHGAKLLKKGHQATAVALASHLWWQTPIAGKDEDETVRRGLMCRTCMLTIGAEAFPGREAGAGVPAKVAPDSDGVHR